MAAIAAELSQSPDTPMPCSPLTLIPCLQQPSFGGSTMPLHARFHMPPSPSRRGDLQFSQMREQLYPSNCFENVLPEAHSNRVNWGWFNKWTVSKCGEGAGKPPGRVTVAPSTAGTEAELLSETWERGGCVEEGTRQQTSGKGTQLAQDDPYPEGIWVKIPFPQLSTCWFVISPRC